VQAASKGRDPQQQQQQLEEPGSNLVTWEAQSVLLLWLSMLVLTPFNLSTVDSAATSTSSSSGQRYTPLAGTLLQLGESYLHHPGECRDMHTGGCLGEEPLLDGAGACIRLRGVERQVPRPTPGCMHDSV
jgi:hypothetical protein